MKKSYFILLYFLFFVPFGVFYKLFNKPIFIADSLLNSNEYTNVDEKVVLMINESKKQKPSIFIKLLELIVSKYN
jgi:hypothetical protein